MQIHPNQILPLKQLIIGGEASHWEFVESLKTENSGCEVFNHYGPTETTVGVLTYRVLNDKDNRQTSTVPLGRPIANTEIYLLDSGLEPAPIGVPGELYIGGENLARGYLNQAELTADRFIPNPFRLGRGERLYKTGDLARYLGDGNIEFLGRLDHQVKIRGYRIELGEVEAQLSRHPAVVDKVVIALEDEQWDKCLVAYIVSHRQQMPAISELRSFLKEKLPDYMIPAFFVNLEALPLTPHGKLDRKALPKPERYAVNGYEAPVGETETTLARVWAAALKLERVGRNDNFFELGGHSLLAVSVVEKMRQEGLRVDVRALFTTPVLSQLAAAMEETEIRL
jgi:acyl-CoA synthetase (AMP-forming)/AMP-acid ligase II/aryl carrier-like protein